MARAAPVLQTGETVGFRLEGDDELLKYLREIGEAVPRELKESVLLGGWVIANEAQALAGSEGVIAEVEFARDTYVRVAIGPDKEHWYLLFRETGARPHEISPDDRAALKLYPAGDEIYSESLHHPGVMARPFLRPAVDRKEDTAVAVIAEKLTQLLRE